jgi:hypothetical protein
MQIYVNNIVTIFLFLINVNFMLIYVNIEEKIKIIFFDICSYHRQTDTSKV